MIGGASDCAIAVSLLRVLVLTFFAMHPSWCVHYVFLKRIASDTRTNFGNISEPIKRSFFPSKTCSKEAPSWSGLPSDLGIAQNTGPARITYAEHAVAVIVVFFIALRNICSDLLTYELSMTLLEAIAEFRLRHFSSLLFHGRMSHMPCWSTTWNFVLRFFLFLGFSLFVGPQAFARSAFGADSKCLRRHIRLRINSMVPSLPPKKQNNNVCILWREHWPSHNPMVFQSLGGPVGLSIWIPWVPDTLLAAGISLSQGIPCPGSQQATILKMVGFLSDDHEPLVWPIPSMYDLFTYIYHKNQPNVGKYTIYGWYGWIIVKLVSTTTLKKMERPLGLPGSTYLKMDEFSLYFHQLIEHSLNISYL